MVDILETIFGAFDTGVAIIDFVGENALELGLIGGGVVASTVLPGNARIVGLAPIGAGGFLLFQKLTAEGQTKLLEMNFKTEADPAFLGTLSGQKCVPGEIPSDLEGFLNIHFQNQTNKEETYHVFVDVIDAAGTPQLTVGGGSIIGPITPQSFFDSGRALLSIIFDPADMTLLQSTPGPHDVNVRIFRLEGFELLVDETCPGLISVPPPPTEIQIDNIVLNGGGPVSKDIGDTIDVEVTITNISDTTFLETFTRLSLVRPTDPDNLGIDLECASGFFGCNLFDNKEAITGVIGPGESKTLQFRGTIPEREVDGEDFVGGTYGTNVIVRSKSLGAPDLRILGSTFWHSGTGFPQGEVIVGSLTGVDLTELQVL